MFKMTHGNILFFMFMMVGLVLVFFFSDNFTNKDPKFVKEKSDNYENIQYFAAKYNMEDLKISKDFNTIEYKNKKYYKKNKYMYLTENNKKLKLNKHPYYYITHPILTNQIKKQHNIPKLIWQTLRDEPKEGTTVYDAIKTFKSQKGWKYNFVTDKQGEEFLKEHFEKDVLHAFRVLIPGAFKADLLRACLLYINGGVYADAKLLLHCDLDSFLDRDLVLVREFDKPPLTNRGIWNGFMATTPKQEYFKLVIDEIVENVKNMDYTECNLGVTGPSLYGKVFIDSNHIDSIQSHKTPKWNILNTFHLNKDNKNIINMYNNEEMFISWDSNKGYRKNWSMSNYGFLWRNNKIFDKELHKKYFT